MTPRFINHQSRNTTSKGYMDSIHPNAAGYRLMAECVRDALETRP
jgi:lysophospholipase L1-like esterase